MVYFAYSPRNAQAVSPDSTPEARAELDAYLRRELCVPVITPLEDSVGQGPVERQHGREEQQEFQGVEIHVPSPFRFYTFQALSYVLDVYRGRTAPEGHFGYYALFISFFPQPKALPTPGRCRSSRKSHNRSANQTAPWRR